MPLDAARRWLASVRNPDGSWGYLGDQPGRAEPTLLVAAAGGPVDLDWLEATALGWEAWLAPAALRRVPETAGLRALCVTRILGHEGIKVEQTPDHDGLIPAWAWVEDTAPWVEPTCYAVLSLQAEDRGSDPRAVQGRAMLVDRQCTDGGWNYGNPVVLDQPLESFPGPTAWAVMALPTGDVVRRGLVHLDGVLERSSSTSLALAVLARAAHGADLTPWVGPLLARQASDGSFGGGRVDRTALATAALHCIDGGLHPFATPAPA